MRKILMVIMASLMIASCGIGDTNTTYARSEIGAQGKVETGTIIDMMKIKTEGRQGLGTIAGGVAGGAAGSLIGGNTAVNVIGGAVGALAGAVIAGKAEEKLTEDVAVEFTIQKTMGSIVTVVQSNELNLRVGDKVLLSTANGTTRIRSRVTTTEY